MNALDEAKSDYGGAPEGAPAAQSPFLKLLFRVRVVLQRVSAAAAMVSAVGVVAASVVITWAVFARGLLGVNTIWELEFSVYLLIYAAFLSAAFTDRSGGQISVQILAGYLKGRAARAHTALLEFLALCLFVLVTYSGWNMFLHSWETGWRSETLWGPPLWVPHLAIPLGGTLLVLSLAVDLTIRLCGGRLDVPQGGHH